MPMKMFIDHVKDYVADTALGLVQSHPGTLAYNSDPLFVYRKTLSKDKVALISGGGSGHEPAHIGFVGQGMLDAACPGQVFTSPVPNQIAAAIEQCDTGSGALLIVKNYQGDIMNFDIARQLSSSETRMVVVNDDVSEARRDMARGLAGVMVVEKLLGAAAERGLSLGELQELGESVVARSATMGLMFSAPVLPSQPEPNFDLAEHELELGVGIHGEHGHSLSQMKSARDLAKDLFDPVQQAVANHRQAPFIVVVNGLGATTQAELWLMYHHIQALCDSAGLRIERALVGNYVTSLNASGCSLSLVALDDDCLPLWRDPVSTASLRW